MTLIDETDTSTFPRTPRNTVRRLPARAAYDRNSVAAILDEGLVAHIGFAGDRGQPFVLPTAYARLGDKVIVHGSVISRMMKVLSTGVPMCLTVTLIDGLVLARSAFHHSMNYRSVTVFGEAVLVTDPGEKAAALKGLTDKLTNGGRWDDLRPVTSKEVAATTVLALPLAEAVAKSRSGPPKDDAEDMNWPVWAGVVPLSLVKGEPITDQA
ncbi:pyridoxamine 5'-phosphate oxidase family protein [Oleomonas cavernae]|uniref:Pyridoxamine 5'-phosphate oxidase family protein n=1 Tax=Oleomonas cavernae TaxID=2320859 RepID=A0A418WB82_9PROT|nr:pyridoxamine 5'-phosphate oxidase family protein [Oleomonas cavernae]RJF87198.1 pyridoxamine 5'-phosphate oxidase family protein [Oleomonas cavernae]